MNKDELRAFFAYTLKDARERAGITQDEMATKLEVTQPAINKFESGNANVTSDTIWKYMNALDLEINFSLFKPRKRKK